MQAFSFSQQWAKERRFLSATKHYFFIALAVLLLSALVTALVLYLHPAYIDFGINFIMKAFGDAIKNINTNHQTFFFILTNNIRAMALMILWGLLPFVFIPLLSAAVNGAMLTFAWHLGSAQGMGLGAYLAYILPHGIIELPTMCLSCGIGLYLCVSVIQKIIGEQPLKPALIHCLRSFLMVILPLTVIAAVIEAYITPYIGALFL